VPIDRVEIVARVPWFIEERNFTEGQLVKKGDLLFRIEQETYKAAVDQQTANLAKTKANEVNANLQLQRNQALVKTQAAPQATLDRSQPPERGAQADICKQPYWTGADKSWFYEIHSPIDGRINIANFIGNLVQPSS
jgi:membrane fusion protein (multidrug efflux system)